MYDAQVVYNIFCLRYYLVERAVLKLFPYRVDEEAG